MSEEPQERRDQELNELLQELRVALPGVQVLFAFLLTVPFSNRFGETSEFERGIYLATLLLAAAASALLIAPSAQHRLLFRRRLEARMLITANRLVLVGMACLALSIIGAVLLVTHVLFGLLAGALASLAAGLLIAWAWYALPLRLVHASGAPSRF
jgi:O-antigen/teichoic acid export membrane protein